MPDWDDIERRLARLPQASVVRFALASAARVLPDIRRDEAHYGPEAREWSDALTQSLRAADRYAEGVPVTRFQLDVAAEVARCVAAALTRLTRERGPGPHREAAELAAASVAFAVDAARAPSAARAAAYAMQSARAATGGDDPTAEQLADLAAIGG